MDMSRCFSAVHFSLKLPTIDSAFMPTFSRRFKAERKVVHLILLDQVADSTAFNVEGDLTVECRTKWLAKLESRLKRRYLGYIIQA